MMSIGERLCLHTITNKPWSLDECLLNYERVGIRGISIWRNVLENQNLVSVKRKIQEAGLEVVSLVRGGFFTGATAAERENAFIENRKIIDEAVAIGAPLIVLVCGATPKVSIHENLQQIQEGIERLLPYAQAAGVRLGVEPLHPMYADTRSAVSSLQCANDLVEAIHSPLVGVTLDVFHTWWEPNLSVQIKRCADHGNLFSFHICDWKVDMKDKLNDRGLMGDGIIDVKGITEDVEENGFTGFREVEVFSEDYWRMDQKQFLDLIMERYQKTYSL